ncbi:MAG: hypothetical protein GPJ54_04930 [Candidatus Heimdallarchaeota archaeon]|nr:hypothetical protein [Candidatus Heimdallarchaeota archaeon]
MSDEDIKEIHLATLRILEEVGIQLTHEDTRKMMHDSGATLDDNRVLFPRDLVETLIAKCPSIVKIRGRNGNSITLGDGSLYWHNLGGARDISFGRDERKAAKLKDLENSTKVLHSLENVNSITPLFTPQDVGDKMMAISMYRHTLPHTTKPVRSPGLATPLEAKYIIEMANVFGPAKDLLSIGVSPLSPLHFPDNIVETMITVANHGVPLGPLPCPIVGATAPMTLAGALVQQNAEFLASVVIAQLITPGLPMIYRGRLSMMEPRTGISVWGGPEIGTVSAATTQIAHFYKLPVNVYGFSTNSHTHNVQNGYERALNAVIPALAGADELSGIGELEAGVISSLTQLIIDNEIINNIKRTLTGFEVNEETLAMEVISSVMKSGSRTFLSQKHTRTHMHAGEVMFTKLAERRVWSEWVKSGKDGMNERAELLVDKLLTDHTVEELDQDQIRDLDRIMEDAKQEINNPKLS